MTTPDITRLEVRQAHVVARVRRGVSVRDAAAEVHMSPKSIQHWRERTPGFAERLNQARRDARIMAKRREQERFFALVKGGMSIADALRRLGLGSGQAWAWLRDTRDRGYAHDYRRLLCQTGRSGKRMDLLLAALGDGASVSAAARAGGWTPSAVCRWRITRPDLWARVIEAQEESMKRRSA